jgi:hypothetical protein
MSTKTFTFDPDAGVPYGANLAMYGGSNFTANFVVQDLANSAFDLSESNAVGLGTTTGWTGSAQMQKSAGIGATTVPAATFAVGFTSAYDGKFKISLGTTETGNLSEGRYEYNILVSSGATTYNIVNGNILVYAGIASAP